MSCCPPTGLPDIFTLGPTITSYFAVEGCTLYLVRGGVETLHDLFRLDYEVNLYHFTLYYYDRAGHLVRTVPPAGVRLVSPPSRATVPSHVMVTTYEYNSLGQPIAKNTPDGGTTTFFYDAKQRLRFSQDARQAALYPQRYSYQQYDSLSRVVESGEAMEYTSMYVAVENFRTLVDTMNYPVRGKTEWTKTTYTTQTGLHYLHDDTSTVRAQRHLRNRVSSRKTYQGVETVYSYDPHGNVAWVYQNLPGLGENYIGYEYDLISNRVKQVLYDAHHGDQFYQRYGYDEDGRVTTVESSRDSVIWDRDAEYSYFLHGPLMRIELGEDRLQGLDYTHTIHGWLKAINHPALSIDTTLDPGHDNGMVRTAPDVFGMILNYYEGDFVRNYGSGAQQSPYNSKSVGSSSQQAYQLASGNLYNGNISGWSLRTTPVGMPSIPAGQTPPALYTHDSLVGYSFRYDALNRLRTSSFSYYSQGSSSAWNSMGSADYYMSLAYDPNGNIDSMTRHGYAKPGGSVAMDKLTYSYPTTSGAENNRLRHVKDSESSGSYANDIDDEPDDNYLYDPSGNLIYDQSEGTLIRWNAQGKVTQVRKITATVKKDLIYIYDGAGERIAKKELDYLASGDSSWVTYYVRDAGEKVIAVYRQKLHYSDTSDTCPPGVPGSGMDTDADGIDETPPNFCDNCNSTITPTLPPEFTYRNPWQEDYDNDGIGDACDPCPFGPGDECGTPLSDTAVVPMSKWIPSGFAVLAEWHIYGSSIQGRVGVWKPEKNRDTTIVADTIFTRILTLKEYELKDHLGNVTVVISDLKTATTGGGAPFGVDVKSFSHYYPFGMLQPGAFGSNREYRFGYNGKESDNDWKGEGNVYDYGFRVYDPRIAKFLSVDPLAPEYPSWTPYAFAMGRPVDGVDLDGLEWRRMTTIYKNGWKTVDLIMELPILDDWQRDANVGWFNTQEIMKKVQIEIARLGNQTDNSNKIDYSMRVNFRIINKDDVDNYPVYMHIQRARLLLTGQTSDSFPRGSTLVEKDNSQIRKGDINIFMSPFNQSIEMAMRTIIHELLHNAGLGHPDGGLIGRAFQVYASGNTKYNIMNSAASTQIYEDPYSKKFYISLQQLNIVLDNIYKAWLRPPVVIPNSGGAPGQDNNATRNYYFPPPSPNDVVIHSDKEYDPATHSPKP